MKNNNQWNIFKCTHRNFLFVDKEGNLSELAIVDEDIMKHLKTSRINLNAIAYCRNFAYFKNSQTLLAHHTKMMEKHPADWLPYLYPAQRVMFQNQCYYYSYIEQAKLQIFAEKPFSHIKTTCKINNNSKYLNNITP